MKKRLPVFKQPLHLNDAFDKPLGGPVRLTLTAIFLSLSKGESFKQLLLINSSFLILLSCSFTHAQTYSVKGLVKTEANEGASFATVSLKNAVDSSLAKADLADVNGGFKLVGVLPGKYFVNVSSVGFEAYNSPAITIVDSDITFEPFVLESNANMLKEVEVKAIKPMIEVLADKTVFNVQSTLSATGTTGFELLRKAPGVIIDNNDNLIVEGKSGVLIYIDGRPSPLTGKDLSDFLKTLQASDIEAIEIITQPSSKYDAAGNAGIVNIKLKKDKRFGTNGSVAAGYAIGRYAKYNTSLSLNNRNRKANFFGNYSNRFGKNFNFINIYRQQSGLIFDSKTNSINDGMSHNAKGGVDIFINRKNTLGVILNANINNGTGSSFSRTLISRMGEGNPFQVLVADNTSMSDVSNLSGNINYRFADTLGHELNIDADYAQYISDRQSFQPNRYLNGDETQTLFERIFRMNTPTNVNIATFKVDYEQYLWKGKFSTGFKIARVSTDNTFSFFNVNDGISTLNPNQSNNFIYTENVNAAYVNFNRKWKKWNVQAGLRLEQTVSDGKLTSVQNNPRDRVQRNYTNLFPSGGLTYAQNQNNSWALTYSRRIQRPNYQSLNPFQFRIDELSYRQGNAFLQPQYTDNIKLSHTYKYTLTTSVSYSYVRDFFAQITDTTEVTRNFIMEQNVANQQVLNLGVSYPFNVKKWWNVYLSVNAFRSSFASDNPKFVPIKQSTVSFYGQNTFTLPKGFKAEVSGWFSSPSVWGGTYVIKSLGSLDLALQKKILKDKVDARISVSDLFVTSFWNGNSQFGDLLIRGNGGWESRQVRLNLSYSFGNNEVKASRRRKTGLEDERGRLGQ
jgi:iron complex outermembrane receptor protein